MKMYKGFDKDLKCRDFQYEIGKTYEELTAELCKEGFHACEYPLDVFKYYAPGNMSRYCEVDLDEVSGKKCVEDSKRCGKKIAVKAEIYIAGIVKAAVDYTMDKAIPENSEHATGLQGAASATGEWGAASATGDYGAASATGLQGAASATGDYGAASATGWQGAASATGWQGAASATGKEGVAAALGNGSKAKGALGCWIVLAEWGIDEESNWHRKYVQCFKVDGETVKPNTWYTLKDGRPFEVDE